jgi:hypothetical protein
VTVEDVLGITDDIVDSDSAVSGEPVEAAPALSTDSSVVRMRPAVPTAVSESSRRVSFLRRRFKTKTSATSASSPSPYRSYKRKETRDDR